MIRRDKVHAICCTGANLEEDVFNLVAHDHYVRIPQYRQLTAANEDALLARHLNRVTDTCIPEEEAIRRIGHAVLDEWTRADQSGERYFPHEFFYRILRSRKLKQYYQIDPKDSWLLAACEKNLPIIVPGWEVSTLGNSFASHVISGDVKNVHTVRTGIEYMTMLAGWYQATCRTHSIGRSSPASTTSARSSWSSIGSPAVPRRVRGAGADGCTHGNTVRIAWERTSLAVPLRGRRTRVIGVVPGQIVTECLMPDVLVRKPSRLQVEVPIDYLGFDIPDVWAVGYGLDCADRWRTLPCLGVGDPASIALPPRAGERHAARGPAAGRRGR